MNSLVQQLYLHLPFRYYLFSVRDLKGERPLVAAEGVVFGLKNVKRML
jgi:hypothetical protein